AAGQGLDAADLADAERSRLLRQALDWLTADLAAWAKVADRPDARQRLRRTLDHWRGDPDLAGVRDEEFLTKLPEAEPEAWRKLWADVAALLGPPAGPKDGPAPPGKH